MLFKVFLSLTKNVLSCFIFLSFLSYIIFLLSFLAISTKPPVWTSYLITQLALNNEMWAEVVWARNYKTYRMVLGSVIIGFVCVCVCVFFHEINKSQIEAALSSWVLWWRIKLQQSDERERLKDAITMTKKYIYIFYKPLRFLVLCVTSE